MHVLLLAQSAVDELVDGAGSLGAPVGLGVFILAVIRIVVGVTGERARVCEADRVRCTERLDAKDVIVTNLTNEVSRLNSKMDEGRRVDEDARRYLDGHFSDIKADLKIALAELRGR